MDRANLVKQAIIYRVVQLYFTPEIEVFSMLFDRCHSENRKITIKQHTEYFNFLCKIQLDNPVLHMIKANLNCEEVLNPSLCLST